MECYLLQVENTILLCTVLLYLNIKGKTATCSTNKLAVTDAPVSNNTLRKYCIRKIEWLRAGLEPTSFC